MSPIETGPNGVIARCTCGWADDIEVVSDWQVDREHDRLVRQCPDCGDPRPAWGTFRPLDGVARIAHGRIQAALRDAGVVDE